MKPLEANLIEFLPGKFIKKGHIDVLSKMWNQILEIPLMPGKIMRQIILIASI